MARPKHLQYILIPYELLTSGLSDKEQKVLANIIGVIQGGGSYRFDNRWIADYLCTHPNSVSRIVSSLKSKGLVEVFLVKKEGTHSIDHRTISLTERCINAYVDTPLNTSVDTPLNTSVNTPLNTSVKHNNKDINNKYNNTNIPFSDFWNLYDKKVGDLPKLKKKWALLKDKERTKVMDHLPLYVPSTPNKKYRKDPYTYLNNSGWTDEIIIEDISDKTETLDEQITRRNQNTKAQSGKILQYIRKADAEACDVVPDLNAMMKK